jgi:hypothetical protein
MKKLFTLVTFLLILNFYAHSQVDTSYVKRNEFGRISFARFGNKCGEFRDISGSQSILLQYLKPSTDIKFRL